MSRSSAATCWKLRDKRGAASLHVEGETADSPT
jgi:hypothetical protein